MAETFAQFLEGFLPPIVRLERDLALSEWHLATTGKPEYEAERARLEGELLRIFADPGLLARLASYREGTPSDPLLARQLDILYRRCVKSQMPPAAIDELVRRQTEIESIFTNFRAELDGRRVSNNEILHILREETDDRRRRAAWEASKQIGRLAADRIRALVNLRNRIARDIGYADYYAMSLTLGEVDETFLFSLLGELRRQTDEPFARCKQELDERLAARYGLSPRELMPWHYEDPFFQEAPAHGTVDLDPHFADKDVVALSRDFFREIGLPAEDILRRSDLFEREGKDQHAFCTDIDRSGDVRILCNVRPTARWMGTMLHELGHAVYDKWIDPNLPWLLRTHAHISTTEAIAMLMGRQVQDPAWLSRLAGVPASRAEALAPALLRREQTEQLIFVRWGLVMVYFERDLYRDPDQDLDRRWWQLVNELQLVPCPAGRGEPDWAAKIHLGTVPVYYHNYLLGETMASQLQWALARETGSASLAGRPQAGEFLRSRVFWPGSRLPWPDLLRQATGEPLNPQHFVAQLTSAPA